jgi:hypothetical protein
LADFLVEFSIVLHKRAMYPLGHPHLQDSTARFVDRLESLVASRDSLAIGIARHQLIVAGVATDPRNALLSDLARRLHRHRVATLRLDRGVTIGEIDGLLSALSGDPKGVDGPLGLRPDPGAAWSHLKIQPPELNRMLLQDEDDEPDEVRTPDNALWMGLAHLALSADGSATDDAADPLLVARAIDVQPEQVDYDRVVLGYLAQIAGEMAGRQGDPDPRLRDRVSQLVSSLKPETLRRLLEAGADHAERRHFARQAAGVLAVDAVMELIEAAAATTGHGISHQLLRLLRKLAHYAEQGPERTRAEAESTLRRNVAQLIAGWDLEDPNPDSYTAVLDSMGGRAPDQPVNAEDRLDCEPETVVQIGLETGCRGPRVYAALETLLAEGRLSAAVDLLHRAPAESASMADELWNLVATPTRLRIELEAPRPDLDIIQSLTTHLGALATEPLLDMLEHAVDRGTRARMLRLLASIGPSVAPTAAARIKDAPWYVQRNMLVLLQMLNVWPPGFSAVPFARHPDVRIRREAYKLLLAFPANRGSAIVHGLTDTDSAIVTLVLRAAAEDCPAEAVAPIERFASDGRCPTPLRALAVRAIARVSGPNGVERLLELAGARRSLFGWRLDSKSPVVLAAVSSLARYWSDHPRVESMLQVARKHDDPEIRLAARVRYA